MVKHLACIMDGNRRWAKKYSTFAWEGHREGVKAAQRAVDFCLEQQIPYLSLYTFSLENFNRPKEELHFLFSVIMHEFKERVLNESITKGVRISFIGDTARFPKSVLPIVREIEEASQHCTKLHVQLLFCYGGRQEIVHGVRMAIDKIQTGELAIEDLDEHSFQAMLWSGSVPPPDLIIRTGGVQRLSNFLLFQAAYSEFFFLDCFWPEINQTVLTDIMQSFKQRQRNFGS
jgi:undecaprenyl diphosphate synthase